MNTPEFASAKFTAGQLNAIVKILGEKNIPGILDGSLKIVLNPAVAETPTDMISRRVRVNRNRTPQQEALYATKQCQYTYKEAVGIPKREGEEVEVFFFRIGRLISDDDLQKEYDRRGLVPDPYAQIAVNEADPAFADDHPNATHWKDSDGKWCYSAFGQRYVYGREVSFYRLAYGWDDFWWFAGVRKYQK